MEGSKGDWVYKAIMNQEGRKIEGTRTGKMFLSFVDGEGYVKNVTWKQFKSSNLPWSKSQEDDDSKAKKDFIQALLSQEKQFNKKVDYNSWHNRHKNADFETKVEKVFELTSAKYPKTGLKSL